MIKVMLKQQNNYMNLSKMFACLSNRLQNIYLESLVYHLQLFSSLPLHSPEVKKFSSYACLVEQLQWNCLLRNVPFHVG